MRGRWSMAFAMEFPVTRFALLWFALCVLSTRGLKACASHASAAPWLQVPDAVAVPSVSEYKLQVFLSGVGSQYYRYNGSEWVNYSAKARLYSREGRRVGRHFYLAKADARGGQPTWETLVSQGVPRSLVTGAVEEKSVVDERSIAWVLLRATNNEGNKEYFGDVAYVQRIDTRKGLPPSSTSGDAEGDVLVSRYTANYAFYVRN